MIFDPTILEAAKAELVLLGIVEQPLCDFAHVGSTYISGEGEDIYLVLYVPKGTLWAEKIDGAGYKATGNPSGEDDEFNTFRKGPINLMVTDDRDFLNNFAAAAEVCKYMHSRMLMGNVPGVGLHKQDRIKIHRILMNGEPACAIGIGLPPLA